ncbi:MAG: hypothetical protein F4210_10465 [Holophagales bacterium]|nr:hypothetical protein [Holophagales bacterium]MYF95911.1 hypothetical protein [Holophagales bacterium]
MSTRSHRRRSTRRRLRGPPPRAAGRRGGCRRGRSCLRGRRTRRPCWCWPATGTRRSRARSRCWGRRR